MHYLHQGAGEQRVQSLTVGTILAGCVVTAYTVARHAVQRLHAFLPAPETAVLGR
jgi:hypothetical protein